MGGCIFCMIANGEIKSSVVYEDEDIIAFDDLNPGAPVHVLVIPKKHISGMLELNEENSGVVAKIIAKMKDLAGIKGVSESGFRVVANSGENAGQSVHHLHFHLLGGRKMSWPPG